MQSEVKEVWIEESKEKVLKSWLLNYVSCETQTMRRVIHRDKAFLRKGGLLIVKVRWDIDFDPGFFIGHQFKVKQKFSLKKPMKVIEVRFGVKEKQGEEK